MRIQDNLVAFEASDIQRFSPAVQRAIQTHGGNALTPEQLLSDVINGYLAAAKATLAEQDRVALNDFVAAFALADEPTRDAAQVFIDQAKAVVGIPVAPAPGAPAEEGLFAKIAGALGF